MNKTQKLLLLSSLIMFPMLVYAQKWDERIMYGLKGPVKVAEFPPRSVLFPSGTIEFAEDGTCLALQEREKNHEAIIIRERNGRIEKLINPQGGEMKFTYYYDTAKYNSGALVGLSNVDSKSITTWSFGFEDNGDMAYQSIDATFLYDNSQQGFFVRYEVLEKDKYGNWLKRKCTSRPLRECEGEEQKSEEWIETCKITYF